MKCQHEIESGEMYPASWRGSEKRRKISAYIGIICYPAALTALAKAAKK